MQRNRKWRISSAFGEFTAKTSAACSPLASPSGRGGRAKRGRRGCATQPGCTMQRASVSAFCSAAVRSRVVENCCNALSVTFGDSSPKERAKRLVAKYACMSCFQQLFKARTSGFRAVPPSNCTKNQKNTYFRALSIHKTHPNPHSPAGAAIAAGFHGTIVQSAAPNQQQRSQNFRFQSIFSPSRAPKPTKTQRAKPPRPVSTEPPPNGPMKLLKTSFY